jgi:nitrite reductase (NO-forming)
MPFPGLKTKNARTDVIAHLVTRPLREARRLVFRARSAAAARAAPAQPAASPPPADQRSISYIPDIRYTLRSGIAEGRMVYIRPRRRDRCASEPSPFRGRRSDGADHSVERRRRRARHRLLGPGRQVNPNHRQRNKHDPCLPRDAGRRFHLLLQRTGSSAGRHAGTIVVTPRPPAQVVVEADISEKSTEVPPPIATRAPQTMRVDLLAVELEGRLAEGTTFGYLTLHCQLPAPMLRVRVRDTLDVHVKNSGTSR